MIKQPNGALGAVRFDSSVKGLVPCRRCSCIVGWQFPPVVGQPGNKLTCQGCNSFHGWLSPNHPQFIASGAPKAQWKPSDDDVIDRGDLFE